ncbi:MAG: SpvB/TcaC N-terminal domain-containing protein [Actinomycetota bacterium]|nr:SpvB/TcaC N-terminal domain-containing protein [Actinomycetota bacterium]
MSTREQRRLARRIVACAAGIVLIATGLPGSAAPPSATSTGTAAAQTPAARPASVPPAGCTSTGSMAVHKVVAARKAPYNAAVAPGKATPLAYEGARLTVGPDAVDEPVTIGITPLAAADLPKMGSELTNVTPGPRRGWRFTPHPFQFAEPVEISLPYDPAQVAPTFSPQDVYTFWFDDRNGCWKALERVRVDETNHVVVSRTDHFTDMAVGVLTLPEYPQGSSFNPTQIAELGAATPATGVNLVSTPVASNTGEARLSYTLEMPPGRGGVQPSLAIAYDSTGGNSWLGQGWDLSVPAVTVDPRWGVPRYDSAQETETYLMGNEQLAPVANRGPLVARTAEKVFHPRVEGSFDRIVRHGTGPADYSWETVDKTGKRMFYGGTPASTLRDDAGNVFQWALREVRDAHGNIMRLHTVVQDDVGVANGTVPGRNIYLQKITYTGTTASPEGPYAVTFIRDRELEEPRRGDVAIDARGGFKRVTADLLRRVEITLNDLPVRAYELNYRTGAFGKTLLDSVTQFGEGNQQFNKHTFAYHDDIRDGSGSYQAFSPVDWTSPDDGLRNSAVDAVSAGGGQAGAINANTSSSAGGHLYVGFSATRSKTNSVGVKTGFATNTDTGLLALIDVDGDNLPDKVFTRGDGVVYRKNLAKPGGAARFADTVTELRNLPGLFGQRSNSSTVGVESYLGGVAAQLDHVDTFTTTDRYLADVNADGISDLVNRGNVLFGRVGPDGTPVYGLSSDTPVPIGSAPVDTAGLLDDLSEDRDREIDSHPLADTVRRWVAPYDGTVAVSGDVRLIQDTGADRQQYTKADGVRVAVQREDDELWSRVIEATDYDEHVPTGVDAVTVKRGDRLYFRVQSRFDGAYDQVAWDPRIVYTGVPAGTADVNGLDPYAYQASTDFTLGGRVSEVTVPLTGTLHLTGSLTKKAATTDDVTAVITRDGQTVFSRTIAAADTGEIPLDLDLPVQKGQKLSWRIKIDSPIDLSQVTWTPKAAYAEPETTIEAPYAVDLYPVGNLTAPQAAYTAPADGTLTVAPAVAGEGGQVVLTVKKRGALLAKRVVEPDLTLTVPVTAGDELFFDFSTLDATVTSHEVRVGLSPDELAVAPSALHTAAAEGAFPQPYRGWGAIGYNGNKERASRPINQGDLVVDESYRDQLPRDVDPQAQKDEFAADPRVTPPKAFPFTPDPAKGRWGNDNTTWVAPSSVSSSRLGAPAITVPTPADFDAATAVPRLSRSTQISLTGGVSLPVGSPGGSVATGDSSAELDYLDLNGDGFPDVIGAAGVQYTDHTGTLSDKRSALPDGDVRRTGTVAGNATAGSAARTITTGRGHAAPPASGTANTAAIGNDMPPLGVGGNLGTGSSDTRFDLLDINGDTLPDRVYADGRAALNLGYRFAAAEPWPGGKLSDGATSSNGANVGFNTDFYGFAGGASFSRSSSSAKASLLDVTGDGLADRVFDGNPIRVAINTGNGFTEPQPFLGGAAGLNDDVNAQLGGGAYATFSACFLIIAGCVITNPGVSTSTGIGRTQQTLRDINGDGYADQLRSTSDNQLSVGQNTTGRTNLLKTVNRPLGSRLDLDYTRDGNTYDQPHSRFVLSKVALTDGRPGDGQDTQVTTFRYAGGVYDRFEREFRGYRTVINEQRDPAAAGQAVHRATTTEYDTGNHYTRGLVTSTRIADAAGRLYTELANTYQVREIAPAVAFPQLVRTDQSFYEGQETPARSTRTEMAYDEAGNLTRTLDLAGAGAADDVETKIRYTYEDPACRASNIVGTVKAVDVRGNGTLMRHRESTVDCATGDVKQHRAALADGSVATTDVAYFANGNVQSVTEPPNAAGKRYKRTYEYDPALATHATAVSDSYGYRSTTSYNLKYGLPETVTDTNGQQSRTTYDQFGRTDIVTGPYEISANHPTIDFEYHPEATVPYAVTRNVDRNADGTIRTNSIDTITFTDGLGRVVQTKKDATIDGAEAMIISGRVEYDFAGRVVATSYPVTEAKGPLNTRFSTKVDAVRPTRTSYDVLDRATRTTLPDGSTTTVAYGFGTDRSGVVQNETAVTDAKGTTTSTFTDVKLRPTAVRQAGDQPIWTSYGYNPLGEITSVTDDRNNVTRSTYDNLGRRTSVDAPDTGKTTSSYDLAGNLTKTVTANLAAKHKSIRYEYEFNRVTEVSYPTTPEADVRYTYGNAGAPDNAAGRITKITDAAGTVTRGYGPLGEVTTETRTVSAGVGKAAAYTTRYQYDTWNRVQRMTYPDGEVLTYHYNNGGLVDAATGVKGSTSYPYLTTIEYDAFEQRTRQQTGNGVSTAYTYDAVDRRLATQQAAQSNGTTFQSLDYAYDLVGNVTGVTESAAAIGGIGGPSSQTFGYDSLNRLVSSTGTYSPATGKTNRYGLSLGYDTLGNTTAKNQTHDLVAADGVATPQTGTSYQQAYEYTGDQPHAPTKAGPFAFKYDLNGNMTTRTGPGRDKLQLTWNDANQVSCSTGTGSYGSSENNVELVSYTGSSCDTSRGKSVEYIYDGSGTRVVKNGGPNNVSIYPSQGYTQRNKTAYKHIFVGDARLVSKLVQPNGAAETGQFYFQTDHLGSTAYGTDSTGKVVEHTKYLPSGESWASERTTAAPSPYGFTGKELDAETGLYYYGARYYDPRTNVFQSPDPALASYLDGAPAGGVGNPGNLAAYTYASNNPVRLTDPDGRWVNIAIGAAVGALISTGVEGYQQYRAGEFSARRLVGAAAGGAVSGAIGGATLGAGLLAEGGVAVASSVAEGVVSRAITGEPQTLGAVGADALTGVVVLGATKGVGKLYQSVRGGGKGASEAAGEATTAAKSSVPCHSFSADTKVLRGDGTTVRIKDLRAGDTVLATDPLTGETTVRKITDTHLNADTDMTDLTVTGGSVIRTTQHHKFWSETRQAWVDAVDLRPGERLRTAGGDLVTVEAAGSYIAARDMFDLTVDEIHTYYVLAGTTPVLVHNCGEDEGNFVYRNLRPDEDPSKGLVAKNPQATYQPAGHVLHGSRPNWRSQYISTTRSRAAADKWTEGRMVKIDLEQVPGSVIDISTEAGRAQHGIKGYTAINRAKSSQEVLLTGEVPSSAITWVVGGPVE